MPSRPLERKAEKRALKSFLKEQKSIKEELLAREEKKVRAYFEEVKDADGFIRGVVNAVMPPPRTPALRFYNKKGKKSARRHGSLSNAALEAAAKAREAAKKIKLKPT